ncbi:MAG: hypothetical protein LC624_09485 [Halobacteriales archaeon]|nr:hypothetical protein [Halobacteriales archaeon]
MRALVASGLALLALAVLLPPAQAAAPQEQAWKADLGSVPAGAAQAMAFDPQGQRIAVVTGDTQNAILQPDNDFVLVPYDSGKPSAENDTEDINQEGKGSVALSANGNFAVAGGNYSAATGGANVFFYQLPDLRASWTAAHADPTVAVAVSADGAVVAAGSRSSGSAPGKLYVLRGTGGSAGQEIFERSATRCDSVQGTSGDVVSLGLSDDGKWVAVAFRMTGTGSSCVQLYDSTSVNPKYSRVVNSTIEGDVTALHMSPNGAWFAAGTSQGRFFVWRNQQGTAQGPLQTQLGSGASIVALRVASDGSGLVVADGGSVTHCDIGTELDCDWNAPVAGVRSLDATPDGQYIVAGGSGGVVGLQAGSNATLWTLDAPNALVRLARPGASDLRIAVATGTTVRAFHLGFGFSLSTPTPQVTLNPGQPTQVQVQATNSGSAVDTLEFSGGSPGVQVSISPLNLTLRPGESGNVTVTLVPNAGAVAQAYTVRIDARSPASGTTGSVSFLASVAGQPRVVLGLQDASQVDKAVFQGDDVTVVVQVANPGNQRVELSYELEQRTNVGQDWSASLSRTSGSVDAYGVTTVSLSLRVPFNAQNGTENVLTVTARGEGVLSNVSARLVVNPIFTASISVIPQSKVVVPGKSVLYDVVVSNNGTLREQYKLVFCRALPDQVPCIGNATLGLEGWSVALDGNPFYLDHGESKAFQLSVAAPRGAIAGVDKLALQVEVVSTNPFHKLRDSRLVITGVQEQGNANAPKPTFTPGPEMPLALGLVAAAAWAARRRA